MYKLSIEEIKKLKQGNKIFVDFKYIEMSGLFKKDKGTAIIKNNILGIDYNESIVFEINSNIYNFFYDNVLFKYSSESPLYIDIYKIKRLNKYQYLNA